MVIESSSTSAETFAKALRRLCMVVIFAVAFAYIEAAVVVYLRAIFHADGFSFPLTSLAPGKPFRRLLLVEVGREAATLVLIFTGAWLSGRNGAQRFAFFATIFAVWDIFYYVWLKILLDWPGSVMDWDLLFLIPVAWASPVLAPVIVSAILFAFAVVIIKCDASGRPVRVRVGDWVGFSVAGLVVVCSFCMAGAHISEAAYREHFSWPLFFVGCVAAIALFVKCVLRSRAFRCGSAC
jgi:hypothetical protein